MTWLTLFFALELGFIPQAGILMYEPSEAFTFGGAFYTELEAEIMLFDILFAGGGVRTYVTPGSNRFNFSPNNAIYDFRAGLRFGDNVEVCWWHRCFHPSFPYLSFNDHKLSGVEGSYDEVYVRFTNKRKSR